MKELSIEEKARAYDEAFRIAQELYNDPNSSKVGKGYVCTVFPKLKESEDDKIRKAIYIYLDWLDGRKDYAPKGKYSIRDMLAWLEKQGETTDVEPVFSYNNLVTKKQDEQKPADTVEHKFEIGDWVVFNNKHQSIYQVEKIEDGYYILRHTHGGTFRICVLHNESLRLWTILDAKDGDVLYLQHDGKEHIIIYKGVIKERFRTFISAYCAYNSIVDAFCFADVSRYTDIAYGGIMPATKEQRDTLFTKMKEAGYEWDVEKKELKKIENEIEIPFGAKDSELQEATYYIPKGFYSVLDGNKVIIKRFKNPRPQNN